MTVVIGVGNPWRGDDGLGHHVVGAAARSLPAGAEVVLLDGEPSRLLDAWAGHANAVVVDGVQSGEPPGTVRRWQLDGDEAALPARRATSSHAAGVQEAVRLGRALGRLPERLLLVTVEIASVQAGAELSPSVTAAVPAAVDHVIREVTADVPG